MGFQRKCAPIGSVLDLRAIMQHHLATHPRGTVLHVINSYFDRVPDLNIPLHLD